jgi:hypothetical protein
VRKIKVPSTSSVEENPEDQILKIDFDEKNSSFLSFSTIFFPLLEPMVSFE